MTHREEWINKIKEAYKPSIDLYSDDDLFNFYMALNYQPEMIDEDLEKELKELVFLQNKNDRELFNILDDLQYNIIPEIREDRIKRNKNYIIDLNKLINDYFKIFIKKDIKESQKELIKDQVEYLKNYYADLLLMQYQKPKAIAEIKHLINTTLKYNNINYLKNMYNLDYADDQTIMEIGKLLGIPQDSGQFIGYEEWVFGVYDQEKGKYEPFVRGLTSENKAFEHPFTKWIENDYFADKTAILPLNDYKYLIKFLIEFYSSKPNLDYMYKVMWKYFRRGVEIVESSNELFILIINTSDLVLSALKFNNLLVPFIGQKITVMHYEDYMIRKRIAK